MDQVEVIFNDGTSGFHPIGNLHNVKRLFGHKIKKINFPEEKIEVKEEVKRGRKPATN
jgi:hypothetical protein